MGANVKKVKLSVIFCLLTALLGMGLVAQESRPIPGAALTGPQEGTPRDAALRHVRADRQLRGMSQEDLKDLHVTEIPSRRSGLHQVYLQQRYKGIPIAGAVRVVNFTRDNRILSVNGAFQPDLSLRIRQQQAALSPLQILELAGEYLGLRGLDRDTWEVLNLGTDPARTTVIRAPGLSRDEITLALEYLPTADGSLALTWTFTLIRENDGSFTTLHLDARTGTELKRYAPAPSSLMSTETLEKLRDQAKSSPIPFQEAADLPVPMADTYRAYELPVESPNHSTPMAPADGRTLISNPAGNASAAANPFGWHSDGTSSYTTTQGNNVNAQKSGAHSDCGATLDCDHGLDLTISSTVGTNLDAAIDHSFYLFNVMHNILYDYGFDEVAGNFQESNNGKGGLGGDNVVVNVQAAGNCNANGSSPIDGNNPTVNLFNCNIATPTRDGAFDATASLYALGQSLIPRITGGPSNASCMNNNEQPGSGMMDFLGLIMTMESGDSATDSRTIGTWLLGQGPSGAGVRSVPYSTDFLVNDKTYDDVNGALIPHGVGEVWATMMWEVTWNLIAKGSQSGFDPDWYNGTGGNNLALQLYIDGMKLMPCSPGFVDARDAILQADTNLTGGANQCVIWEAFARRGLGFSANQGASSSIIDGTEAFDIPASCNFLNPTPLTQDICVGSNAVYSVDVNTAFNTPVTMSASGHPAGTTATFSPNPVNGPLPETTTLTISNTAGATGGPYTITITGDDTTNNESAQVGLSLFEPIGAGPTLLTPAHMATGVGNPTFTWSAVPFGNTYLLEIDDDPAFGSVDFSYTKSGTSHDMVDALNPSTVYYWRVTAQNVCGVDGVSSVFQFTTGTQTCATVASTDVPVTIPTTVATVTSTLDFASPGQILDLEVKNLTGTHTYVSDLQFTLISPASTSVLFFTNSCGSNDDFDIEFDDESASAPNTWPCPPIDGGSYQPINPLSAFDGEDAAGTWTLSISDTFGADGGSLDSWSLRICYSPLSEDFDLGATPDTLDICPGGSDTSTIDVTSVAGFTGAVALSSSGEPADVTTGFSPTSVDPSPGSSTMTVTVGGSALPGSSTITVSGTGSPGTHTTPVTLNVLDPNAPPVPTLSTPADLAEGVGTTPTLTWNASTGADDYLVEVASDSGFSTIVYSATEATTSHTVGTPLSGCGTFYWRVTANGPCQSSAASSSRSFTLYVTPTSPTLATPGDGTYGVGSSPTLSWNAVTGVSSYDLQVASDAGFATIVYSSTVAGTSDTVGVSLENCSAYYWRVRSSTPCEDSAYSSAFSFFVFAQVGQPTLLSPANGAGDLTPTPTLSWTADPGAKGYDLEIATDAGFGNVVYSAQPAGPSHTVASPLLECGTYHWRVRARNSCETGTWASSFSFDTAGPFLTSSLDASGLPVAIPSSGTSGNTVSTLTYSGAALVGDLNLLNLQGTHTWIGDLSFTLESPLGTTVTILNLAACGGGQNFFLDLDDESPNGAAPCPPTDGMAYTPTNPLSAFDGEDPTGTWTLTVIDSGVGDSGQLDSWTLEITDATPQVCSSLPAEAAADHSLAAVTGTGTGLDLTYAPDCNSTGNTVVMGTSMSALTGLNWTYTYCGLDNSGSGTFDPGDPQPGEFFYFVLVPHNGSQEGSYGSGTLDERNEAFGFGSCDLPQVLGGTCP